MPREVSQSVLSQWIEPMSMQSKPPCPFIHSRVGAALRRVLVGAGRPESENMAGAGALLSPSWHADIYSITHIVGTGLSQTVSVIYYHITGGL